MKNTAIKKIISSELPALFSSILIAEAFFEFGSFLLECGAFLVTWFLISFLLDFIFHKTGMKKKTPVVEMPSVRR